LSSTLAVIIKIYLKEIEKRETKKGTSIEFFVEDEFPMIYVEAVILLLFLLLLFILVVVVVFLLEEDDDTVIYTD